jgi:hypothetical protein
MDELAYGKWCTVKGERYMIVDWTKNTVTVYALGENKTFAKEVVEEVSDFFLTPKQRAEAGLAF